MVKAAMFLLFVATCPPGQGLASPEIGVEITLPQEAAAVAARSEISGVVSDPAARVVVVIHPVETSGYWVQPSVGVRRDGTWSVLAYFGRAGERDRGKTFELRAFANPREAFGEEELSAWPLAEAASELVAVIRE